jgi:NitT/TauT family transport system substrate-binding protein
VFWAQETGIYAEEGIEADIIQGGSGAEIQLTDRGQRDFMVATIDDLPVGIQNGAKLKAVALIGGDNPAGIILPGGSEIQRPADLEGKTVGISQFGGFNTNELAVSKIVEADGGDPSQVSFQVMDESLHIASLFTGGIDAISSFSYEDMPVLLAEDPDARVILYRDYGVDAPGIGVVTRDELIESDPDLVRRFVRATARAFAEVVGQEEEAIEAARKYYPENYESTEQAVQQLTMLQELIPSPVGVITEEDMQTALDGLVAIEAMTEADVRPVDTYFTDQFIPDPPIEKSS